ncbi:hypothetical protein ABG768_025438, partial [Culter alburnus]
VKMSHSDQTGTSLGSVFEETADSTSESSAPTAATTHMEAYLGETTVRRSDKPFKYWVVICDFKLWLKHIFQPHAVLWKVKDCSAQSDILNEIRTGL